MIKNFHSLLNSNLEIKNFIKDPTQSISQQIKFINILIDKLEFSKNFKKLFFITNPKKKNFFYKKISESFLRLCSKKRGEIKASLISSKELSQLELEKLSKELSNTIGSTLKFDYKLDKELIGGLKFNWEAL